MENLLIPSSSNAILAAVRQLSIAELERLVDQVIALRAERVAPHLRADERALLAHVNQGLSTLSAPPVCERLLKSVTLKLSRLPNGRN